MIWPPGDVFAPTHSTIYIHRALLGKLVQLTSMCPEGCTLRANGLPEIANRRGRSYQLPKNTIYVAAGSAQPEHYLSATSRARRLEVWGESME